MSIISASTLTTTALQLTADTAGTLVFRTGATPTTALTLNADQSATFAGTVNFSTAGFTNLSISGVASFALGSVSAPSITFTGDTNTGIYSPGADTIAFVEGGVEAMRIDSSGNVGIGISSPAFKLQVIGTSQLSLSGAGTQQALQLNNSDTTAGTQAVKLGFSSAGVTKASINAAVYGNDYMTFNVGSDTERMRIDTNGNVGIGTNSPAAKLNVGRAGTIGVLTGVNAVFNADSNNQYGGIQINSYDDNTKRFAIINNNGFTSLFGYGSNSIVNLGTDSAQPVLISTSGTERMRIDSSGNVGIGTSSPSNKLQVNGNISTVRTGADAYIFIQETSSQNYAQALVLSDSATSWFVANRYGGSPVGASGFGIGTTNAGDMLQIDTSGNVYLGTAGTSIRNSSGRPILNQTGGILQVIQTVKTNVFTTTSSSYVDITGYSVTITPSSTSSKILVMADLKASNLSSNWTALVLVRDSTQLYLGVESGYTGCSATGYSNSYIDGVWQNTSMQYLDSPATTSAVTYKVQIRAVAGTAVVGRTQHNPNSFCVPSSITVLEIAG